MARDCSETSVYLLRDSAGDMLYVGVTDDVERRFREHARNKDWWPLVHRRSVLVFPDRHSALAWEAALIEALLPQFNQTGAAHQQRKRDLHEGIELVAGFLGMP